MRILITVIFAFSLSQLKSQIHFYKTYSGNGYDKAEGIIQLEDSSYMITGSSSSWSGNSDAFLLHIDSLGNYKWSRNYGGQESDGGKRVLYNPNLGFYIAGFSNSYNSTGDFDAYLLKTDLNGNDIWHKTYGKPNYWERINDAVMTLDSGIIMVGESVNMSNDNSDILIVRTTSAGDTLWTKTIGGVGKDIANSIIQFGDKYLIGGQYFIPDSNMVKGFVMELNDQGNVLRLDTISDKPGNYFVTDLSLGVGKYYVIGYRENAGINNDYYGIFDIYGDLLNHYTFVYPGYNTILNQAAYIAANDRVAIGYQTLNPGTNQDAFDLSIAYYYPQNLFYIAPIWSAAISNYGLDQLNDLIPTSDGAFITVGFNSIVDDGIVQPNGGSNIFVAKVGPDNIFPNAFGTVLNQLVGFDKQTDSKNLIVCPNPFSEFIEIQYSSYEPIQVEITNQMGQIVLKENFMGKTQLNTTTFPAGIYFLRIDSTIQKIVKR